MNNDIIPIQISSIDPINIPVNVNLGNLDLQIGITGVGDENYEVTVEDNIVHGDLPIYDGSYEVTPNTGEQTLPTTQHQMIENVVIHQIPLSIVGNIQGGLTATIG